MNKRREANRAEAILKLVGALILLAVLLIGVQIVPGVLKGKDPKEMMATVLKLIAGFVILAMLVTVAGLLAWKKVMAKAQRAEPTKDPTERAASPSGPACPKCGGGMVLRNGKHGKFWGCNSFPKCRGTRQIG